MQCELVEYKKVEKGKRFNNGESSGIPKGNTDLRW